MLRKTFMDTQLLQKIEATVYLKREVTTFAVKEVKICLSNCNHVELRIISFADLVYASYHLQD